MMAMLISKISDNDLHTDILQANAETSISREDNK